jgi:hypothetical protein
MTPPDGALDLGMLLDAEMMQWTLLLCRHCMSLNDVEGSFRTLPVSLANVATKRIIGNECNWPLLVEAMEAMEAANQDQHGKDHASKGGSGSQSSESTSCLGDILATMLCFNVLCFDTF